MTKAILQIKNLKVEFGLDEGQLCALDGIELSLEKGSTLGVIGESGCGKSMLARSILRMIPQPGRIAAGEILFCSDGNKPVDLCKLDPHGDEIRKLRGKEISIVFQEPMTALSPVHTIGFQIMEMVRLHFRCRKSEAKRRTIEILCKVGIPDPASRFDAYAAELSGGLRQRVLIAMALCCNPSLVLADEPTTALDPTVKGQILELLNDLQRKFNLTIIYISHDLGAVSGIAGRIMVMYAGQAVEYADKQEIFDKPLHPYTQGLLKSIPVLGKKRHEPLDTIKGIVPVPIDMPDACSFYDRCPKAMPGKCDLKTPPMFDLGSSRQVRCYLYEKQGR